MDRMKILKNPDMDLKFCPVESPPEGGLPAINNLLPPHRFFEQLRDGTLTWPKFLSKFEIQHHQMTAYDRVLPNQLADLFATLEHPNLDRRVHFVFMNAETFAGLRTWDNDMDNNREADLIRQGQAGYVWGALVLENGKIPKNHVIVSSEDCLASILVLGIETFKESKELVALENEIQAMSQELNSKYRRMIDIIHNTIDKIENKDRH